MSLPLQKKIQMLHLYRKQQCPCEFVNGFKTGKNGKTPQGNNPSFCILGVSRDKSEAQSAPRGVEGSGGGAAWSAVLGELSRFLACFQGRTVFPTVNHSIKGRCAGRREDPE